MNDKKKSTAQKDDLTIVNAPHISLTELEKAGEALLKFYRALGWNSDTEILDPSKVRTTKLIFDQLYNIMYEKCADPVGVKGGKKMNENGV